MFGTCQFNLKSGPAAIKLPALSESPDNYLNLE